MKVAIVTSKLNAVGGVEIFNRDLKAILEKRKHRVDVFGVESLGRTTDEPERDVGEHFNAVNKRSSYDVVVCNGEFGYVVAHPRAINLFHGNYVGYARSVKDLVDPEITAYRMEKAQMQKVSAEGKTVVTVSDSSRRELEDFGISVDAVIPNSANTTLFFPQDVSQTGRFLAVARGRYYEKGLDVIKRLADRGLEITLHSDTDLGSPNIQQEGFVENADLCREYNGSKALLFPSRFEGGSLTTLEAMACGCPVVTTPTGYGLEIEQDVKNFVARNFSEFFVKAMLVANEREKYSRLAIDYFWAHHSPENFRKKWTELIEGA